MRSVNNIYYTADSIYKRFAKSTGYSLSGYRIDFDTGKQIEFVLAGIEGPEDIQFFYDRDVVEIYSEKEYKFFLQKNKYLFESGLLKEFRGKPEEPSLANMLTDDDVESIAGTRNIADLTSKLSVITSSVALQRIYDAAVEIGKSKRVLDTIQERINAVRA